MGFLGTKRGREGELDQTITTMANCLMLLSRGGECDSVNNSPSRVFECKTCNRQFTSFQALGGHRASHKKPKLVVRGDSNQLDQPQSSPAKPKTHECSICGLEFAIGQALGGHMRRHRVATSNESRPSPDLSLSSSQVEEVKKSSSNDRRVLWLDLNLSPRENGLDFQLEKVAPMVHCFL